MRKILYITIFIFISFTLIGCAGKAPRKEATKVVGNFKVEKYMGTWYEIGRMDYFWERNLKNVKADYFLDKDGTIKILNSGIDIKSGKQKQKEGKAKFLWGKNIGALETKFGIFSSQYNIIKVDSNYNYALIYGKDLNHIWLLSRTKTMPRIIKTVYLQYAQKSGYDISKIIWTVQE